MDLQQKRALAEIQQILAATIECLVRTGFDPKIAAAAVMGGDLTLLNGSHKGE